MKKIISMMIMLMLTLFAFCVHVESASAFVALSPAGLSAASTHQTFIPHVAWADKVAAKSTAANPMRQIPLYSFAPDYAMPLVALATPVETNTKFSGGLQYTAYKPHVIAQPLSSITDDHPVAAIKVFAREFLWLEIFLGLAIVVAILVAADYTKRNKDRPHGHRNALPV